MSCARGQLTYDGTRTETRFCLSAKWTSPFKSAGVSVQLTTGSQGLRISGSNVGYTMFQGGVKGTGYPLHSPVSSLPLSCVTICHHISTGVYLSTSHLLDLFWSLITLCVCVIIVTVVCIYLNSPEVLNDKLVTFVIYCTVFW